MIVLVCGGRAYDDATFLIQFMDAQHKIYRFTHVLHGNARGADTLADAWAVARGIQPVACKALWSYHGPRSAGPIRNSAMAALNPHIVIAFPGGSGTAHMVSIARERGIKVIEAKK